MRITLFDQFAAPPGAVKVRLRERRHPCGLFIRKVKGWKYQLRWWLEGYGSVNCGLYSEEDAELVRGRLASESAHHPPTPLGLWVALRVALKRLDQERPETDWPKVLPMWVRRVPGGYGAKVRVRGRVVELSEVFAKPADAHRAMLAELGREPRGEVVRPRRLTLFDLVA